MPNPEASSTPSSNLRIRSRKGIHDEQITVQNISNTSPIRKSTPKDCFGQQQIPSVLHGAPQATKEARKIINKFQNAESDTDNLWSQGSSQDFPYSSDSDSEPEEVTSSTNRENNNKFYPKFAKYFLITVLMAIIVAIALLPQKINMANSNSNNYIKNLNKLQQQFSNQDANFWSSIKINLQEVAEFNQPRVIIFLYKNNTKNIAENILKSVSQVAVCYLTDCQQEAIDIEGSSLNSVEIQEDFGQIVSNYREKLQKSGVFIIKNLQLMPGKSAQALHLFCDEYYPVVKRALFLFTVKVDQLPADKYSATNFLENLLLKAWNDIGVDDKFQPLFARISGTVLTVQ